MGNKQKLKFLRIFEIFFANFEKYPN